MILRINELQEKCRIILSAVDSNSFSTLTDTLELVSYDNVLEMNVTNKEYFVNVTLSVESTETFHATVNASLFLKLISKITTDTVELRVTDNNLIIIGNGTYKIPLIYEGTEILSLPKIDINNVTIDFSIDGNILYNINKYNTKQLSVGIISRPVQKLYYIDEMGAITFTSGACVNKFTLSTPVKMLLNQRLVKMFNLFKDIAVKFSMGYDSLSDEVIQTKVRFETDDVVITSILSCDDSLISSVPVDAIRGLAYKTFDNSVVFNKNELIQTIDRLMLFPAENAAKVYSTFEFSNDSVRIYDSSNENNEVVYYNNSISIDQPYTALLDLNDLKAVLDGFIEQYVNMSFGDNKAIVITSGNIYNIIPEVIAT